MIIIGSTYLIIVYLSIFFHKKTKLYFAISCILLAYISYNIAVFPEMDLFRHYQTLELFRNISWEFTTNNYLDTNPLFVIYLYLIGFMNNNGWLPAITVFVAYYLISLKIYQYGNKVGVKNKYVILCFLFILFNFNYNWLVSGIRSYLAFAIFSYFLYSELIEGKHKRLCWSVYIGLCFFHWIMTLFLLIRILLLIKNRHTSFIIVSFLIGIMFFLPSINNILSLFTNIQLFSLIVEKYISYRSYSNFGKWQFLFNIIKYFTLVLIYFYCRMYKKKYVNSKYDQYVVMIIALLIGTVLEYQMFLRTTDFLLLLLSPYIIQLFSKNTLGNAKLGLAIMKLIVISEAILMLSFYLLYEYRYGLFFLF